MGPGRSFGEIALILSAPRTASVVAEANTTLVRIDREGYDRVLRWGAHRTRLAMGRASLSQHRTPSPGRPHGIRCLGPGASRSAHMARQCTWRPQSCTVVHPSCWARACYS